MKRHRHALNTPVTFRPFGQRNKFTGKIERRYRLPDGTPIYDVSIPRKVTARGVEEYELESEK